MASWNASSQIVTSKKEAQKKGIYSYPEKKDAAPVKSTAAADKEAASVGNDVIAYEPVKETRKGGPSRPDAPARQFTITDTETDPDFIPAPAESYLAQQIVNNAMEFEGVRYRGGGTTKDGMDCSGMVYATFLIFDMKLPRSSHEMAKSGKEIKLNEVKKGDLLFFDNNPRRKKINHVGIVTEVTDEGEIKFLHSSSSSGVIVSSMNEDYHSRTFVVAKRVIED